MHATELTRTLKARAGHEGFCAVGVAAADRPGRDARALKAWLARDYQASMVWMRRDPERRADPRWLLPGCRSVVALAMNYAPPPPADVRDSGRGRVARYAWGRDYHKVMSKKLKSLVRWLEESSGSEARAFVDTAPVLERAWAERAGLGWIGKNANLITRHRGSWLLLGEVLSVAELEPDPGPHQEFCGTCRACIDACPTGAIVDDGVVDSGRCISYWTIEHRGTIPPERRGGNGEWLFGCDVCQEVCPWNERFARPVSDDRFSRRAEWSHPDPEELLAMDERSFRERFSGSSLMRAKWEGMRRNGCVVLGNGGRSSSVPALAQALTGEDAVVRAHAAWALGRIGGADALRHLSLAERDERSPEVLHELGAALRECESGKDGE